VTDSTFYCLEELDGTPLAATFAGNCLKRFFFRMELDDCRTETYETIGVRNTLEAEDGEEGAKHRGLDDGEQSKMVNDDVVEL